MTVARVPKTLPKPVRAPDPILAELWEAKRQINAEANYDIRRLVCMARAAATKAQTKPKELE
jgi:hypothetical protein